MLFRFNGTINQKVDFFSLQNDRISNQIAQLQAKIEKLALKENPVSKVTEVKKDTEPVVDPNSVLKPAHLTSYIDAAPDNRTPVQDAVPAKEEIKPDVAVRSPAVTAASAVPNRPNIPYIEAPKKPSFRERNPDLEKFIGENLFNKIGIVILVLGMGFFLKFAIDKEWINEIGRVSIGFICGAALIGLAHRMRKSFVTFSSVLVGGGVAILYFTVTIAFQQYQLFSQTIAFILTILITAFTVLLSVSYDRKELALFGMLGGFCAPFMISTGEGNYIILFSYILILNLGMLVLAYFKKWSIINIVCYVLTILLFGSYLGRTLMSKADPGTYLGLLIFAALFYLVFLLMNVINNIKEKTAFKTLEIGILMSNTFLFYTAGMLILENLGNGAFKGLFTALLGLVNFGFAYGLYMNKKVDRNLIYLLIGLVLTFISLAGPVQLEGNQITLFWAAECVLLLWLSQKSGILLIRQTSVLVLILMTGSLIMDWEQVYYSSAIKDIVLRPILNRGFITGTVSLICICLYSRLLRSEIRSVLFKEISTSRLILGISAIVIGYIVIFLELNFQAYIYFPEIRVLSLASYNYLFIYILFTPVYKLNNKQFNGIISGLAAISLLGYLFIYNTETIFLRNAYLKDQGSLSNYLFHYLMVILCGITLFKLYKMIAGFKELMLLRAFQIFAIFIILVIASSELDHLLMISQYGSEKSTYDILVISHKTGYPILWGCFALLCIYLGMKWKSREIRVMSISLLAITLIKLFVFDLRGISEGGKIAAFISLGILLLVISFMYQRLKRLLLTGQSADVEINTHQKDEDHAAE
ncbi:DUF2339 domain-containing protein [Pedobacter metabolipauper]|uniref:Putative membrane protein DUF2339 n=1 Tax=Pedobacter metabolipauper TaxID=425513 RepID=A0A4V3D0W8_9SPHI|nr:DUF2339 domain-containing protein [Pedobacter metabolipauper]TDQ08144.1 putative membrane protein DUF2339 [Pedobacter metabolipauper]